jgi:hypothetical protein
MTYLFEVTWLKLSGKYIAHDKRSENSKEQALNYKELEEHSPLVWLRVSRQPPVDPFLSVDQWDHLTGQSRLKFHIRKIENLFYVFLSFLCKSCYPAACRLKDFYTGLCGCIDQNAPKGALLFYNAWGHRRSSSRGYHRCKDISSRWVPLRH